MNNEIMHRKMLRDYARNRIRRDYEYEQDERRGMRGRDMYDQPLPPQMFSNQYAMGGRVYDSNSRNRYTPRGYDNRESDYGYSNPASSESDYTRYGNMSMRNRQFDGNISFPFAVSSRIGNRETYYPNMYRHLEDMAGYDMHEKPYLKEHELKDWAHRLVREIDEKEKSFFTEDQIIKRAKELGIEFEKFTPMEFYVAVLMMYTDFCKTLGTANLDTYLKLAKDWLCDDDIAVKYSEKLSAYYDNIVEG